MPTHHSAIEQRATAMAALIQSVYLVDRIARKGVVDTDDFRVLMESLFCDAPQSGCVADLYAGGLHLQTGVRVAMHLLDGSKNVPQMKALMLYSAGLMTLEKRLRKRPQMRQKLADGMHRISQQQQYFGDPMHSNIIAALADLYGETISTMKPRIIVRGKSEFLSQQANTQRVRALLMAGLRAAHLWHQYGGNHFNLLLRRKPLLRALESIKQQS